MVAESRIVCIALVIPLCFAACKSGTQSSSAGGGGPTSPLAPAKPDARHMGYDEALATGRKVEDSGDLTGAIADFQMALGDKPDDPTALNELSFAAIRTQDWATAEDAAAKAAALATDPNDQGSAYYNLGRAQEGKKDRGSAMDSYSKSLAVRPNRGVLEHLEDLDIKAAEKAEPLLPVPMSPIKSVDDFCASQDECKGVAELATPGAPFLAAKVMQTTKGAKVDYYLVVQAKKGWYAGLMNEEASGSSFEAMTFEVRKSIPNEPAILVLVGHYTNSMDGDLETQNLFIAGVGDAGIASLTPRIPIDVTIHTSPPPVDTAWSFDSDGMLVFTTATDAGAAPGSTQAAGKHVVCFP